MAGRVYIYFFILNGACLSSWMNIECEIGIRGDTCQCSGLSQRCRQTQLCYRPSAGAPPLSCALQTDAFPLCRPGEACLPFSALIFLLESLLFTSFLYAVCSRSFLFLLPSLPFFLSPSFLSTCFDLPTHHWVACLPRSLRWDSSSAFYISSSLSLSLSLCLSVFLSVLSLMSV